MCVRVVVFLSYPPPLSPALYRSVVLGHIPQLQSDSDTSAAGDGAESTR